LNPNLEHLVDLQAIDLEMRHLRAELDAAPRKVTAAEKTRADAESAQSATEKALAKEESLRRSQESDIDSHRAKIKRLRQQMDAAVSAAQINALEHEINFAQNAIAKLEDEELASIERTDNLELRKTEGARTLAASETSLGSERKRAADVTERNRAQIANLEAEREALRKKIEDRLLSIYDRVAKARATGVAEAFDGKCSACQMKLRPQRWNDLTGREHLDEIFTCESCGRVLFWDPRRDAPGDWPAGDRLKAAIHPVGAS
jgi:uncharacterized protein